MRCRRSRRWVRRGWRRGSRGSSWPWLGASAHAGRWDSRCARPRRRSMETSGWRCSRKRCRCSRTAPRGSSWHTHSPILVRSWLALTGAGKAATPSAGRCRLAGECGAIALAERARAELEAGPGRRARIELTGPQRLDRSGVARVPSSGRGAHQPRGRAGAVRDREDDRAPPQQRLSQAGIRSRFQLVGGHRRVAARPPRRTQNRRENTRGSPLASSRAPAGRFHASRPPPTPHRQEQSRAARSRRSYVRQRRFPRNGRD